MYQYGTDSVTCDNTVVRSNIDIYVIYCGALLNSLFQAENVEWECNKFEFISSIPEALSLLHKW